MALRTKCIFDPKEKDDGLRVSIMRSHNNPDGVTPDSRIQKDLFNRHLSNLAPSEELLGQFHRRRVAWEEFEKRFSWELELGDNPVTLREIAKISLRTNVTILSVERDSRFSHRRVVADKCQQLVPGILVEHYI
ncbi:MAG: DUF488 family protein [Candidatus Pacebacteria bacterium]|jgi:uncharacterized protein YeaO (DUF488 family)|nr:DUF488 family protein [Candidatus Paceibacterota bacterium]